jgi:hypothetical protein
MQKPDDITVKLQEKFTPSTGVTLEDLMKLQRRWSKLAKEASHPYAFCGQKYV